MSRPIDADELKMVEPKESEVNDRLISEQAVIDVINGCLINRQTVIDKIKAIPSAESKTGHWISGICDNCGHDWGKDAPIASVPNFCPNCGAKMIEPQESEEISDRNMKMWEDIFKAERGDKEC